MPATPPPGRTGTPVVSSRSDRSDVADGAHGAPRHDGRRDPLTDPLTDTQLSAFDPPLFAELMHHDLTVRVTTAPSAHRPSSPPTARPSPGGPRRSPRHAVADDRSGAGDRATETRVDNVPVTETRVDNVPVTETRVDNVPITDTVPVTSTGVLDTRVLHAASSPVDLDRAQGDALGRGPLSGEDRAPKSQRSAAQPPIPPARATTTSPAPATSPNPTDAIWAQGLRKTFGSHTAVADVSLSIPRGSILALLGPNGAGKTTTVNMLTTLLRPDGGSARVAGHDVVEDPAGVRRSIMLTGQFAALDEALTGRENLVLFGRLLGLRKPAAVRRADELLDAFGLSDAATRRVREYSGGMRRRIDIACGLVASPEVVFLDEPTTGLDPRSRMDVWRLVESLREQGVTILLTTQYLEEADELSDRIVVIDHGRVIADGTADTLKAQVGASSYEVTPTDPENLPALRAALAPLAPRAGSADATSVLVAAPEGADTLARIVRLTSDAQVVLADVALRRPSLDEVFLALTEPNAPGAPPVSAGPGPARS